MQRFLKSATFSQVFSLNYLFSSPVFIYKAPLVNSNKNSRLSFDHPYLDI